MCKSLIGFSMALAIGIPAASGAAYAVSGAALRCEKRAGQELAGCVRKLAAIERQCYRDRNRDCGADDPKAVAIMDRLSDRVTGRCGSDAVVHEVGFSSLTTSSLIERLQTACRAETQALIARTYGGPHGAAWRGHDADVRACIRNTFDHGRKLVASAARLQMSCVDRQRKSGRCNPAKVAARLEKLRSRTVDRIARGCGSIELATRIALHPAGYVSRAMDQAACMTAIAHPDVAPLDLDCGPRSDIVAGVRGQYVQVVLDEGDFGTRCGDGSAYAFLIRLAPVGHPIENIVLQMQGGGACLFEDQCAAVSAGLLRALDNNTAPSGGIMSNDPNVSPFANWTKVYLPYCTQDVFIGGGITNTWPSVTVHRWGAVNTRAALRYLRDVLWRELDTDSEGYRPDRIKMLFGGTSAGGFGALYNYHYVLDDLQWIHSSAWPDSALALNNGELIGIGSLGLILLSETPPAAWASRPFMPPYCFAGNCAVGPRVYAAAAPRLKREPEQQFLVLSNQVDNTQVNTTFFSNTATWINAARQSYCNTAGTTGLRYFLPAVTSSNHVIATKTNLFTGMTADGIVMRDWLALAMSDPDSVFDAVDEGTLSTAIANVDPFPCAVD
jgi:hypothetical protein